MLKVTIHPSVSAVDPARWDATGCDPLSAHAVLSSLEAARLPGVRIWAATVEDAEDRWIAAAPFARIEVDGAKLARGAFRRGIVMARGLIPRLLKTSLLICGTPLSVGNPPARVSDGVDRASVYAALGRSLGELADREGVPWRAFKELSDADLAPVRQSLSGAGWTTARSETNCVINVYWRSYDEYLQSIRSHYRRKIKLAERALEKGGIRVDAVPLAEAYDESAHALYEAVAERAPVQLERLTSRFFIELGRALGKDAMLIRFRRGTRVVGWVAMLFAGGVAHDLFHGIDYAENASSSLYFNQIAAAIRHAIERQARVLVLGQSSEVAKARFGAVPLPLWVAVKHRNAAVSAALRTGKGALFPAKPHPDRHVFAARPLP